MGMIIGLVILGLIVWMIYNTFYEGKTVVEELNEIKKEETVIATKIDAAAADRIADFDEKREIAYIKAVEEVSKLETVTVAEVKKIEEAPVVLIEKSAEKVEAVAKNVKTKTKAIEAAVEKKAKKLTAAVKKTKAKK
jgi:hypothetical protein